MVTATLIAAAFFASFLSGVYGMAGGLVLLAVYLALLPVPKVMLLHGLVMLVSNLGRATTHRQQIIPSVLITAMVLTPLLCWFFLHYQVVLPKSLIYLLVGLTSLIVWLPRSHFTLPLRRKRYAAIPAGASLSFTLSLGAAGPMIDALFLQSGLTRQQIMANKALLQVFSHSAKVVVFGGLGVLLMPEAFFNAYTPVLLIGSLLAAQAGTWVGTRVLNRMSEDFFKSTSRTIITVIASYYIVLGLTRAIFG